MKRYIDRQNLSLFSNFLFYILNALMSVVFTPIYLNQIGVEGYGIIGIFNSFAAFMHLFEFGIPTVLNREIAKLSSSGEKQIGDFLRTSEVSLLLLSLISLCLMSLSSILIANFWVIPTNYSRTEVMTAFLIMSFSSFFQLIGATYVNGLLGLERHAYLNLLLIFFLLLRYTGSLVVLILSNQKLYSFLIWQLLSYALQTLTLFFLVWREVKGFFSSRIRFDFIRSVYRFSTGIFLASVLNILTMNTDKIILSKFTDLENLSYYTFSFGLVTMIFSLLITPFYNVSYPAFSSLQGKNEHALKETYHEFCKKASLILIPTGLFVCLFSYDLLMVWIRQENFVANSSKILSVLSIGWIFYSLRGLPYRLRLAHGWTRLDILENTFLSFILLTTTPFIAYNFQATGVAYLVSVVAFASCFTVVFLTHKRILVGEYKRWLLLDTLPFILVSVIVLIPTRILSLMLEKNFARIALGIAALIATFFVMYIINKFLMESYTRLRRVNSLNNKS